MARIDIHSPAGRASTRHSDQPLPQTEFTFRVRLDNRDQRQTPRRAVARSPTEDSQIDLFAGILSSIESSPPPLVSISPPPSTLEESPSINSRLQNMRLSTKSPSRRLTPPSPESRFNLDQINNAIQTIEVERETTPQLLQPETPSGTPRRSPRRRRSSPRPNQQPHRVEDEEPPGDRYHTVAFRDAVTKSKELMSSLTNVLASSNIHDEPDSAMKNLHDRAKQLSCFEPQTMRKVGFVGDSGVGKSSLLNSLLDRRGLARATNNGSACTCVATEYHYHNDSNFVVEVDALTAEELKSQSAALLGDYRIFHLQLPVEGSDWGEEEKRNLEQRARVALDSFHVMFGERLADDSFLLGEDEDAVLRTLVKWCNELRPVNIERRRVLSSLAECSSLLMQLTAEQVSGQDQRVWPFIRRIRVYLDAHILSKGLVLVDLPGLRDLNSARLIVTERYLRECHEIFAVCNIGRASTDAGVMGIFELAKGAKLNHVGIICTRSDDIRAEEAKKDWKGKKAREIEKMMAASAETLQELEDIIADIEDLDDDREYGTHENKKERDRLLNDKYTLEKQKKDQDFRLKQYLVNNRNNSVTKNLLQAYGDKIDGEIPVFCISNTMYWDNRDAVKSISLPFLDLCGILRVRKHCIAIVSENQLRQATTYMQDQIPALLSDLVLWVESGAGSMSAEKKESIRNTLNNVEGVLKRDLVSNASLVNSFASFMGQMFMENIYERRQIRKWTQGSTAASQEWSCWHHATYSAFCRNWGDYTTNAAGSHCWNEEAIGSMVTDLTEPWNDIYTAFQRQESQITQMVEETWDHIIELLESSPYESSMTTVMESMNTRKYSLITGIETVCDELDFKLNALRTDALSGIRTSFIGQLMNDSYMTAMSEFGSGSDRRRKTAIGSTFSSERTYTTLMMMFRTEFRGLVTTLQQDLQAVATRHFNDIRGTLDIVRSENVAEESEKDLPFRDLVARETSRLQTEMKQIIRTSVGNTCTSLMSVGGSISNATPSARIHSPPRPLDPAGRETEGERTARLAFETDHPNGVTHLSTSGEGRRCAWEALIGSFAAKFPRLERPSQRDFDRVLKRLARVNPDFRMHNRNMFRIDQMASVLFEWALERHQLNIQLGCVMPHPRQGEGRYFAVLVSLEDSVEVDHRLWVFNNDCRDSEWEGAHFEGLADAGGRVPRRK